MIVQDQPKVFTTRVAVEMEARTVAAKFFLEADLKLRPKLIEVKMNGVGLLILDSGFKVVEQEFMQDPQMAIKEILRLHKEGTLASKLYKVFGMWLSTQDDDLVSLPSQHCHFIEPFS